METHNHDKKIGVFCYEFLGTAFLMYSIVMLRGAVEVNGFLNAGLMFLAWKISGGHFNPAISVGMYVSMMKIGENAVTLGIMIVAQFAGAFFGILLAYLSIIDNTWKDEVRSDYSIPIGWLGTLAPETPDGLDDGTGDDGFTRDWQTFWSILLTSIVLTLCYSSIKNDATKISDNILVQILLIT